jgi:WD repeat-containing protein 19
VAAQSELEKTPCPFCNDPVNAYDLDCPTCQNTLPYCIASGKHILKDQCVFCNNCNFPSNIEPLQQALQLQNECPMCSTQVDFQNIIVVNYFLNKEANVVDKLRNWIKIGDNEEKQP